MTWVGYLAERVRAEERAEWVRKLECWGLFALALFSFTTAAKLFLEQRSEIPVELFSLFLFHAVMFFALYLPGRIEKERRVLSETLQIVDYSSFSFVWIGITAYLILIAKMSFAVVSQYESEQALSSIFLWANAVISWGYCILSFLVGIGFWMIPALLTKLNAISGRLSSVLFYTHLVIGVGLGWISLAVSQMGTASFFGEFLVAVLAWIFVASSLLLISKAFQKSRLESLRRLQSEMMVKALAKPEEWPARFQEASVSPRISASAKSISQDVLKKSHQMANYVQEALSVVSSEKPSEIDLIRVEDRYRKAEHLSRRLEKDHQRFVIAANLFCLGEAEQAKLDKLQDLFLREIRNSKLELASVRKKIDERLMLFKAQSMTHAASTLTQENPLKLPGRAEAKHPDQEKDPVSLL